MAAVLPATHARVQEHSSSQANARIRDQRRRSIREYAYADAKDISARIVELQREWDIERVLEANAASIALVGLGLGATVDRRWFALPTAVAAFLLQHALQGWCPPLPLFRRWGVRTAQEIHEEIVALKWMRGDFDGPNTDVDRIDRYSQLRSQLN